MISTAFAKRISPVQATFYGSLLLSLLAILTNPVINRDGILYVETARIFLQDGFVAARQSFNWPFLPILMAVFSKATGIGLEKSAHILNALFMAGSCALVVASVKRLAPEALWSICLVVLSLPGLNHYREELLREYGCWFFITLSFWLALRWTESPRWQTTLGVQLALGLAALFRPEALAFFAALGAWQLLAAPKGEKLRRTAMICGLPLLGLVVLAALFLSGQLDPAHRLAGEFNRISSARFDAKAQALSAALIPYARDQAKTILFFGSIAITPLKFIKQLGIFAIPFLFLFQGGSLRSTLSRAPLFAWALLADMVVLSIFVLDQQFLAGRYVAVLSLLTAPFIGIGLSQLTEQYPRWKNVFLALALLTMVSNVVSLGPRQTHFMEAGKWLAANADSARTYVEGTRTAYYAGWKIDTATNPGELPRNTGAISQQDKYDLFVLEVSNREKDIDLWLENNKLLVLKRFKNPNNDSVIIATKKP